MRVYTAEVNNNRYGSTVWLRTSDETGERFMPEEIKVMFTQDDDGVIKVMVVPVATSGDMEIGTVIGRKRVKLANLAPGHNAADVEIYQGGEATANHNGVYSEVVETAAIEGIGDDTYGRNEHDYDLDDDGDDENDTIYDASDDDLPEPTEATERAVTMDDVAALRAIVQEGITATGAPTIRGRRITNVHSDDQSDELFAQMMMAATTDRAIPATRE